MTTSVFDVGPAERTYLAEERTFGARLRTALTMLVTALAVARFIYEREPSKEALAISPFLLACAGGVLVHAQVRSSRATRRAMARGVLVPPRSPPAPVPGAACNGRARVRARGALLATVEQG